ncbi:MAG: hypothetical protein ACLTNW_18185 [Mediterraneibacter gnavus]
MLNTGEIFGFWVIEGPQSIKEEFLDTANLPILITDDHKPFKQRKVRILNGAHLPWYSVLTLPDRTLSETV